MNLLLDLFFTFAKIGFFTFGGGYAMISMIEHDCVEKKKWITHDDMMNVTVIAESTPGPIAINCSTFVGFRQSGLSGALSATLGIVMPSFLVIFAIFGVLDHFLEIAVIASAFRGIRIAVGLLILDAALTMMKKMKKKPLPRLIMISSFFIMLCVNLFSWKLSSIRLMFSAAIVSLGLFPVRSRSGQKNHTFLRVGCFAFGGAYGAIPLIRDVVLSYGWLTDEHLTYMIAVSESTPGPIMVNLATYIGSSQAGLPGAVLATTAVVLPSFLIVLLVMAVLKTALKNRYIQAMLQGLKSCIIGIILATGVYMTGKNCLETEGTAITLILAAVLFGTRPLLKKKISPVFLILLAAFLGILVY